MDEQYIQDLWNWTTSQDPTFTDRYTFESWSQKLSSDEGYRQDFHSWVSSQDNTFSKRRPLDSWSELVGGSVKKKEDTDLSLEDGSSESQDYEGMPFLSDMFKPQGGADPNVDRRLVPGAELVDELQKPIRFTDEIIEATKDVESLPAEDYLVGQMGIRYAEFPNVYENTTIEEKIKLKSVPDDVMRTYDNLLKEKQGFADREKDYQMMMKAGVPVEKDPRIKEIQDSINKLVKDYNLDADRSSINFNTQDEMLMQDIEGMQKDIDAESVDYFDETIDRYDEDFLSSGVNNIASKLNSELGVHGFEIEELPARYATDGRMVKITAPNGTTEEFKVEMKSEDRTAMLEFIKNNKPPVDMSQTKFRNLKDEEENDERMAYLNKINVQFKREYNSQKKTKEVFDKELAAYELKSEAYKKSPEGVQSLNNLKEMNRRIKEGDKTLAQAENMYKRERGERYEAMGRLVSYTHDPERGTYLGSLWDGITRRALGAVFAEGGRYGDNFINNIRRATGTEPEWEKNLDIEEGLNVQLINQYLKEVRDIDATWDEVKKDVGKYWTYGEEDLRKRLKDYIIDQYYKRSTAGQPLPWEKGTMLLPDEEKNPQMKAADEIVQKSLEDKGSYYKIKKDLFSGLSSYGEDGTESEAFTQAWQERSMWGKVLNGVAESIPSMVFFRKAAPGSSLMTKGAVIAGSSLPTLLHTSSFVTEAMDSNPEFDNVSENEKQAVSFAIGLPVALLERAGFVKGFLDKNPWLANSVAKIALSRGGANITAKTFKANVIDVIENPLLKKLATVGTAALTEAETGALQEMVDMGVKQVYDAAKGADMFNEERFGESWSGTGEWLLRAGKGAFYEGMGGFVMGSVPAIATKVNTKDFSKIDPGQWEVFKMIKDDPKIMELSDQDFVDKVVSGEMTSREALKIKNNYKEAVNALNQIDNVNQYTEEQQKDALGLVLRLNELDSRIKGKNKELSTRDIKEREEVRKDLVYISENAGSPTYTLSKVDQDLVPLNNTNQVAEDAEIELKAEKIEDIPEQYRERAEEKNAGFMGEVSIHNNVAGLPIGQRTRQRGGTYYTYKLTGKEINNAIQKQSTINMDATQSAANVQEVAEGTSATGPEVTPEQVVETPKETTITEEQSTQLNDLGFTPEMQNLMTDEDIQTSLEFNNKEEASPMLENYTAQLEEMQSLKKEGIEGEVVGVEGEVVVNNKNNETITPTGIRVMKAARKALRSVKERLPKLKMIAHATPEEYHAALGQEMTADNRGERGEIRLSKDGSTIHLNMQFTDDTTIFHEVFHDLLYQNFGIKDMNIQELVSKDLINKIMKVIKRGEFTIQGQDMYDYLENYIKDYKEENVHDEEKLSEIFGALSTQYNVLAPKVRTAIQEFIRKIAKALNIKMPETFTKDDLAVVNMLNTLAFKLRTGEVIQEEDIYIKDPTKTREELDAERKELEEEREEAKKKEEEERKKAEGKKKPTTEEEVEEAPAEEVVEEEVEETPTEEAPAEEVVEEASAEEIQAYNKEVQELESKIQTLYTEIAELKNLSETNDTTAQEKEIKKLVKKVEKVKKQGPAKTKAAPAETTTEVVEEGVNAEIELEIEQVEFEIEESEQLIEEFQTEINNIKSNFKEDVAKLKAKGKKFMKTDEYAEELEELKYSRDGNLESYNDDLKEARSDKRKLERRKKKLEAKLTPTSRKQVAADGSVAPMEINQEFTKLSPTQKRKQLAGRYSKLSHELSRDLLKAQTEYRYADRYERLSKSKNPADIKLFNKQYQQTPPKTKRKIFAATHWYRGIDGKYRYEIPDGKLVKGTYQEFTREGADPTIREARLDEIYIAPEVYKAYPQLKDIMVQFKSMTEENEKGETVPNTTTAGSWNNATQIIKINTNFEEFAEATPVQQRNEIFYTLIHEVQHAIQHIEGFALGGTSTESKAGRGKRITEKFGEGREYITKERIFAAEAQEGLRKKYEILRINNEVASYLVTTLNTLKEKGDINIGIKLLKSKNKGRDLVKILEEYEATDPTLNRIYKEIKADGRYYNEELGRTKVNMTQKNLANLLENALDRYGLNNTSTPKQIDDVNGQLKRMMFLYDKGNMYYRTYGEMESRNVERRAKMKKDLARYKSEIAEIELLGKRKDINALEKIERIEQLENQLYKELPSYTEQFDKEGVVDAIDIDLQGPYIIKEQAQGRRKQVESKRKQLPAREASMEDVIMWGRSRNLTDNKIQALLLERKLGTRDEIKEALRNVVEVTAMPEELANIEGGVQAGEQMFEDVMTEFYRQTMETKEVVEDSASRTNKALEIMRNDEGTYGKETKDKGVFKKNGKSITIYKTKAKKGVELITVTEIIGEPARAMKNVFTKTKGQRREILLDLLEKNKIYKKQSEFVKAMVAVVMDKTLNTRANQDIETEIRAAKRLVRAAKKETKLEQEARNRVEKLIRENIPKKMVSEANLTKLKKLLKSVRDTTDTNALAKAEQALKIIEEITQNEIKAVKKEIESSKGIIARKANPKSGVDGITNLYFQSLQKVLTIYTNHEGDALTEALDKFEQQLEEKNIDGILRKLSNKEDLTLEERSILYDNNAYELMRDYDTMTLEEVRDLHNEIKLLKKEGIEKYKSIREVRRKELEKLDEEVTAQIKENQSFLLDEDGNIVDPNNRAMVKAARDDYRKGNLYSEMKQYFRDLMESKGLKNTVLFGWMYNLPNILSRLDNIPKGQDFLTRNIYERLKMAEERYLSGDQRQRQIFNEMLMTIPAIKEKTNSVKAPYAVFMGMLLENNETAVNKKGKDLRFKDAYGNTITLSKNEALRVYALSKNEIQRARLLNGKLRKNEIQEGNGYSEKILQDIETYLGEDLIKVADLTVNYLSNNYFEGINKVYQQSNNSALQQTPNYFPTKTVQNDLSAKEVVEGDFNFGKNFTAEYMSALKRRSAVKGPIDINKTDNFTSTVDNHFENMERFKAYALDVKTIRDIFRFKSVDALMKVTELDNIVNTQLNSNINPNFVINNKTLKSRTWVGKVQSLFVTYVLAQKPLQILGQASSFIAAWSSHKTKYKGLTAVDREVVALASFSLGTMEAIAGLGIDLAIASGVVKKSKWIDYSTVSKAYEISGTFRNRIKQGKEFDLWGLESGAKVRKNLDEDRYPKLKKYKGVGRLVRAVAGSGTLIGDVLGVMGYMINYKANKRLGMSESEALLEFNKYEQTQQTRSSLEKNMLQLEGNDITRQLTMFNSTFFLQINRLSMSADNILKGMKKGNKVRATDVRDFYTQLFVANAMYVLAKNIFRLTEGDDEDRKDIWLQIQRAAMGMNQLKSIPIVGLAIEQAEFMYDGKPYTATSTNPVRQMVYDGIKMYQDEEKSRTEKLLTFVQQLVELRIGVRIDPPVALYKYFFEGDEIYEDQYFFDMINAPKSLRPNAEGRKKAKEMYESLVPVLGEKDAKIYVDEVMKIRKENEEEMRNKD